MQETKCQLLSQVHENDLELFDSVRSLFLITSHTEAGPQRCSNLAGECDSRWHFHVMCQLQILSVCLRLAEGDGTEDFKDHYADWSPRNHETC